MREIHDEVMASALELARRALRMDEAHVGTLIPGFQVIAETVGDSDRFGVRAGLRVPDDQTFCHRMLDGQIPQVIPDVAHEPGVTGLSAADSGLVRAYVGIPVVASDGTVLGTLCCISGKCEPQLAQRDLGFLRVLAQLIGDRLQRKDLERRELERLEDLVGRRTHELESAQAETAIRLSRVVEFRDDHTGTHIQRVAVLSEMIARAFGADEVFCRLIRLAAPLHDVGKIAAPDGILRKPGRLTPEERVVIQAHTEIGYELLADSESALLRMAASIARTHHERFDGGGYGRQLVDDEIPLEGRIVAIADVFDALTQERAYRAALPLADALDIMTADHGHFDPELLDIFLEMVVPQLPFELPADGARGTPPRPHLPTP